MEYINETDRLPGLTSISRNYGNKNSSGFIYKILPLNTKFTRKVNPVNSITYPKIQYKIGDHVKGVCINDNKKYEGKIVRIKSTADNVKVIAYVLDDESCKIIPLSFKSLRHTDQSKYNYNFNSDVKEAINNRINNINKKTTYKMNKLV